MKKVKTFFYFKDYNNHFQNSDKGIEITESFEGIEPSDLCVEFEDGSYQAVKNLELFAEFK